MRSKGIGTAILGFWPAIFVVCLAQICSPSQAVAEVPGTLLSKEEMLNAPQGMRAWRIRYVTGGRSGVDEQEATGIVLAPGDYIEQPPRGIIAWAHGTWGVASKCAPSESENVFELTPATDAVRMGYIIVAPDYPGLGTGKPHPYLVGRPAAQSIFDGVRATRSITGIHAGKRFVVWGESQGGHAALWTGMTASDAFDLELIGIAAGAPATDLTANFLKASDANARAFLTALAADSWSRYFNVLLDIGKQRTPDIIRKLASNCIASTSMPRLRALFGMWILRRDLRNEDFPNQSPWADILRRNSASPNFSVPLLIAQAAKDPLIAPEVTRHFAERACDRGIAVRWIELLGKDHATTARQSAPETLHWIEDRFAGRLPDNDCAAIRKQR